jgi:adenylate kinase
LVQRDDDKEATVRHRLTVYQDQTRPLVEYYSEWAKADTTAPRYRKVHGLGAVQDIQARIAAALQ